VLCDGGTGYDMGGARDMVYYPCQSTGIYYNAFEVVKAIRTGDHPEEPSWGVYCLQKWKEEAPDYITMVLVDSDHYDAQDRIWTHRGELETC